MLDSALKLVHGAYSTAQPWLPGLLALGLCLAVASQPGRAPADANWTDRAAAEPSQKLVAAEPRSDKDGVHTRAVRDNTADYTTVASARLPMDDVAYYFHQGERSLRARAPRPQ